MRSWMAFLAGMLTMTSLTGCVPAQQTHALTTTMTHIEQPALSPRNVYYDNSQPVPPPVPGGAPPAAEAPVAVRFWIELHPRTGQPPMLVTGERVFHSGERTRYRVAANRDCFLYIAHEGSLGDRTLLYPSTQAGLANQTTRHLEKLIPETEGYFTFDANPGLEHLVIIASPTRVPELDAIVMQTPQATGFRELNPEQNREFSKMMKRYTGKTSGASTKNIYYEADNSGGPVTGQYFAPPDPSFAEPFVVNVTLKHQ